MRLVIASLLVMAMGCVTNGSVGEEACADISGMWEAEYVNCGSADYGTVFVEQRVCELSALLPTQGRITGTIKGRSVDFKITYMVRCDGSSTGTALIETENARVTGSFTGAARGDNCCALANGNFTLTR